VQQETEVRLLSTGSEQTFSKDLLVLLKHVREQHVFACMRGSAQYTLLGCKELSSKLSQRCSLLCLGAILSGLLIGVYVRPIYVVIAPTLVK